MAKVIASASMSLDGYIADASDQVGPLFDWYGNGDVAFNGGDPERTEGEIAKAARTLHIVRHLKILSSALRMTVMRSIQRKRDVCQTMPATASLIRCNCWICCL